MTNTKTITITESLATRLLAYTGDRAARDPLLTRRQEAADLELELAEALEAASRPKIVPTPEQIEVMRAEMQKPRELVMGPEPAANGPRPSDVAVRVFLDGRLREHGGAANRVPVTGEVYVSDAKHHRVTEVRWHGLALVDVHAATCPGWELESEGF